MTAPTPHNTIEISLGWVLLGAGVATAGWIFLSGNEPLRALPAMVREAIFYVPLLILNGIAQLVSIFKYEGDERPRLKAYYGMYLSSLFGALLAIPLRYLIHFCASAF